MEQSTPLLKDYPDKEKEAYLGVIASIATVDREASKEEVEFLIALSDAAEMSDVQQQEVLTAANDPLNLHLKAHLDIIRDSDLRFALVTDIIAFAKADNKYTSEEVLRIKEIAKYLRIGDEQLSALGEFVDKTTHPGMKDQQVNEEGFLHSSGFASTFKNLGIPVGGLMTGLLGILAPLAIGSMFGRRGYRSGFGGGLLGSILGGGMRRGGMGSILSMLSGNRGYGGMNSVLGGLFGRNRW